MEPTYLTGSVVYVQQVDTDELKKGDVITFKINSTTLVTHRIVELVPDEENPEVMLFRTKGDNNNTVDGTLVNPKNVVGKVAFGIPLLGYVSAFLQTTAGRFTAIAIVVVLIALMIFFIVNTNHLKDNPVKVTIFGGWAWYVGFIAPAGAGALAILDK
jgi:signal peptidase